MQGQWIGELHGTNAGLIVLDLDDLGDRWAGHAFAFDINPEIPGTLVRIATNNKEIEQKIESTDVAFLDPVRPVLLSPEQIAQNYSDVELPKRITAEIKQVENELHVAWQSDIGTNGDAILYASAVNNPSAHAPRADISSWADFRNFALSLPPRKYIFRGQDCCHRLRTSFHRTRRKDLVGYVMNDLPNAYHILTAQTKHLFNLLDPTQNAAFLNLLQHHGYPTPLLDWSHSPFVAAFFAFRFRRNRTANDSKVRIFVFDREQWVTDFNQVQSISFAKPHFSIIEALSIENFRALPQQAISSVSNVDDIESYIAIKEEESGKNYLEVIDLPFADRQKVMQELSLMGITAGSLFPGLDGACEELRGRFFHRFD